MILYDVVALQKLSNLPYGSGNYRNMYKIPNGDPLPHDIIPGYSWTKIARNISPDEAQHILESYGFNGNGEAHT